MAQNRYSLLSNRLGVLLLLAAWGACAAVGLAAMIVYETTPAAIGEAQSSWPLQSGIVCDRELPTLLMFVHPRCPCSRASLMELERLASQCRDKMALRIVFVRPAGFSEGWEQAQLWNTAKRIEGAVVLSDANGLEADRFGASTSGESFLYSPAGKLLFRGGLTASRGHEGESAGRRAVADLIDRKRSEQVQSPVFGCPLSNRSSPSLATSDHAHQSTDLD